MFIDNLNALEDYYRGGQNLSANVGQLGMAIKRIALKYNIIIFLLVHSKKSERNTTVSWKDIRDSQLIANACDSIIMVWRMEKSQSQQEQKENGLTYSQFTISSLQKNRRFGTLGNCRMVEYNGLFYEATSFYEGAEYDDGQKNE